MNDQIWIDEIGGYFQSEPSVLEGMFQALARSPNWIRPVDKEQAQRTYTKLKRQRERENCLHGRRPFPINWAPGTHPLGEHLFWVNIEGMSGGPYQVNESDHHILHSVGRKHTHVSETTVREDRRRAVAKMLSRQN
jgi:hypothetical protein